MSNNVILNLIQTTPPITRILVFLTVLVSLSVYLDIFASQQISYSRFYLKNLEFHRIFTTFFYYGRINFELVMNFIFLYRYSSMLEESYGRTSDYFYIILLIFISLIFTSTIFYIPFLGTTLSNTITYIWTRKNPQSIVQIFGFVSFSAFYLPFIFPAVTLIFEGNISKDEIVGVVIGHLIFYFTEVYPKFGGNYFKTPCFLHKLFKEECDYCNKKKDINTLRKKIEEFKKPKNEANNESTNDNIINDIRGNIINDNINNDVKEDIINEVNEDIEVSDIIESEDIEASDNISNEHINNSEDSSNISNRDSNNDEVSENEDINNIEVSDNEDIEVSNISDNEDLDFESEEILQESTLNEDANLNEDTKKSVEKLDDKNLEEDLQKSVETLDEKENKSDEKNLQDLNSSDEKNLQENNNLDEDSWNTI